VLAQNGGAASPINTGKQLIGQFKMNNVTQIVQKVRQAPWRVQRQWIGLFLLGLVLIAMVAGIYLNVTVRATLAGRETISLQARITTTQRVNADLETQLAGLISVASMQKRAEGMGFQPANPTDITFVAVPGYAAQTAIDLSMPNANQQTVPIILPEYTESWIDYFINQQTSSSNTGEQP
jgi:cell division protein FtsL